MYANLLIFLHNFEVSDLCFALNGLGDYLLY